MRSISASGCQRTFNFKGAYKMAKTTQKPFISFKDAARDGIAFIDVTATAGIRVSKPSGDDVEWNVTNSSSYDIEVKVIDFYSIRALPSNPNGSPGGGTSPFADGMPPDSIVVTKKIKKGKTLAKVCNGDLGYAYKYSIVARDVTDPKNPGPWFLVKDPELELDL